MIYRIFLFFYVLVVLMPALRVLDVISSQGLYLNILNLISTGFLIFKIFYQKKQISFKNNIVFVSFFSFLIWSTITGFWSVNKSE